MAIKMRTKKIYTSSERFRNSFKIVELFSQVCGANIFREDYRMSVLTWFVISVTISFFVFTIYTVYVGMIIENNPTIILQSLCVLGTGLQGFAKLLTALGYARTLRSLIAEIDAMYTEYEREHEEYQSHLKRSLALVKRIIYILLEIYFMMPMGLISVPLYYLWYRNEQIFIIQFIIPGIDPTSDWGYNVHQLFHACCVLFGSFGNFACDTLCFLIVAHIPLMKNILKCKFGDMDEVIRLHPRDAKKSSALLKDIFLWHQKYIIYSDTVKLTFSWVIFVQIVSATLGIICTIVCLFLGVWPAGPVYLVYSFVVLYIYCGLGNLVEISNDDVTTIIYDSRWYELTVPEQKMILMMMRESQKSQGILIGGVSPLSLNTGLQLTKSIYTVAMLLNESLN